MASRLRAKGCAITAAHNDRGTAGALSPRPPSPRPRKGPEPALAAGHDLGRKLRHLCGAHHGHSRPPPKKKKEEEDNCDNEAPGPLDSTHAFLVSAQRDKRRCGGRGQGNRPHPGIGEGLDEGERKGNDDEAEGQQEDLAGGSAQWRQRQPRQRQPRSRRKGKPAEGGVPLRAPRPGVVVGPERGCLLRVARGVRGGGGGANAGVNQWNPV